VQSIVERDGVPSQPRVLDALRGGALRKARKSLQPQDSREVDTRRHTRVELEGNDLRPPVRTVENRERPFHVTSCP